MSVLDPDTLVSELTPIDTLETFTLRCHNFASLHHEVRDHSLDLASLIVKVTALFTSAQSSKVLDSLGQNVLEKFYDNTFLAVTLLARLANLNFHPCLVMVHTELGHRTKEGGHRL